MKGDFTHDSFDPRRRDSRVLLQQGRVLLDADWNEQSAILLHRMETMMRDLIGPYGGPEGDCGFEILAETRTGRLQNDFAIGAGRYYVDGLMCENTDAGLTFSRQEPGQPDLRPGHPYLIYLDAWEDYVSPQQDAALREVALSGTDTAGRARVFWRVRAWEMDDATVALLRPPGRDRGFTNDSLDREWQRLAAQWQPADRGRLRVRVSEPAQVEELPPSIVGPGAGYRGAENHLYRVEVHAGGSAGDNGATFKWSRDNGSVLLGVSAVEGAVVTLRDAGTDPRGGLDVGDWVEVVQAGAAGAGAVGPLYRLTDLPEAGRATLALDGRTPLPDAAAMLLRRWDQRSRPDRGRGPQLRDGAAVLVEGEGDGNWLALEDGILIQFHKGAHRYRSGDHWLIPARTVDGGMVDWPHDEAGQPLFRPPHGIRHRYAPLGIVNFDKGAVEVECYSRIAFRLAFDRPALSRT